MDVVQVSSSTDNSELGSQMDMQPNSVPSPFNVGVLSSARVNDDPGNPRAFYDRVEACRKEGLIKWELDVAHPMGGPICGSVETTSKYSKKIFKNKLLDEVAKYFNEKCGISWAQENRVFAYEKTYKMIDNLYELLQPKVIIFQDVVTKLPYDQVVIDNDRKRKENKFDTIVKIENLTTNQENGWKINLEELEKKLRKNPEGGILFLNYPNNPTGAVMTEAEARDLAKVLMRYPKFKVIIDEVYRDMVIDKTVQHFSIQAILKDQAITVVPLGKSRGLAGEKLGVVCASEKIVEEYIKRNFRDGVAAKDQKLVIAAIEKTTKNEKYLADRIEEYRNSVETIEQCINDLNSRLDGYFLSQGKRYDDRKYVRLLAKPQAGNVVLLDFSKLRDKLTDSSGKPIKTSLELADHLLKGGIAVNPGVNFGFPDENMIERIAMCYKPFQMIDAFRDIGETMIGCGQLKMRARL